MPSNQAELEGAAIHVLGEKGQTVLATRFWCQAQTANFNERQFIFNTDHNKQIYVVISNYAGCLSQIPKVSKFQLKDLELRQIKITK